MKLLLILIAAFLIVIYTYTYLKYKKQKKRPVDAVGDFRRNYLKRDSVEKKTLNETFVQYRTKYNSSVDYIEKDEFYKESSQDTLDSDARQTKPKKLQF